MKIAKLTTVRVVLSLAFATAVFLFIGHLDTSVVSAIGLARPSADSLTVAASTGTLPSISQNTADQILAAFTVTVGGGDVVVGSQTFKYEAGAFLNGTASSSAVTGLSIVSSGGRILATTASTTSTGLFTFKNAVYTSGTGTYYIKGKIAKGFNVSPIISTTPFVDWTGITRTASNAAVMPAPGKIVMIGPAISGGTARLDIFFGGGFGASNSVSDQTLTIGSNPPPATQIVGAFTFRAALPDGGFNQCVIPSTAEDIRLSGMQLFIDAPGMNLRDGFRNCRIFNGSGVPLTNNLIVSPPEAPGYVLVNFPQPVFIARDSSESLFVRCNVAAYGSASRFQWKIATASGGIPSVNAVGIRSDGTVDSKVEFSVTSGDQTYSITPAISTIGSLFATTSMFALPPPVELQPDQSLASFVLPLRNDEAVTITKQSFRFAAGPFLTGKGAPDGLTGLSLVSASTGRVIAGPVNASADGTFSFTNVAYPYGTDTYIVKGKLGKGAGTPVIISTPSRDWTGVKDLKSGLPPPLSSAEIRMTGKAVIQPFPKLTIGLGYPGLASISTGQPGTIVGGYKLTAADTTGSSTDDVRITNLNLKLKPTAPATFAHLSACQLYDETGKAITAVLNTATALVVAQFTPPLIVPKGETKNLAMKCTVSSAAGGGKIGWGVPEFANTFGWSFVVSPPIGATPSAGVLSGITLSPSVTATRDGLGPDVPVTATGPSLPVTLSVPSLPLVVKTTVTVSWNSSVSTAPGDWIGFAPVGGAWSDGYTWANTGGKASGSQTLIVPSLPGTYDIVYYKSGRIELGRLKSVQVITPR